MLREIESLTALPPPQSVRLIGFLGETASLFNKVKNQLYYIYVFTYFLSLYLNCTVFEDPFYSIWFLFIII